MSAYNVHAGHCPQGKGASGAVGLLKESIENRKVKDEVIRLLKAEGHTVYDCTCEEKTTQDGCLRKIVAKCNLHRVDLDISIHLNSGRNDYEGDDSTGGVEVWNYDERTKEVSDRICANISAALGIRNRGTKYTKNLYVLNSTKSLALLVECCFVDDKDDAGKWDAKKCAKEIVEAILNKSISSGSQKPAAPQKPTTPPAPTKPQPADKIDVAYRAYTAGKWWGEVINWHILNSDGFAGVIGKPLRGLQANTKGDAATVGYLEYRLHKKGGGWFNWQRDRQKDKNEENYAGDLTSEFDGLQMRLVGAPAGKKVRYRVHVKGKGWLGWVANYGSGDNGYAGLYGHAIDAVQIEII